MLWVGLRRNAAAVIAALALVGCGAGTAVEPTPSPSQPADPLAMINGQGSILALRFADRSFQFQPIACSVEGRTLTVKSADDYGGNSFRVEINRAATTFVAVVHSGNAVLSFGGAADLSTDLARGLSAYPMDVAEIKVAFGSGRLDFLAPDPFKGDGTGAFECAPDPAHQVVPTPTPVPTVAPLVLPFTITKSAMATYASGEVLDLVSSDFTIRSGYLAISLTFDCGAHPQRLEVQVMGQQGFGYAFSGASFVTGKGTRTYTTSAFPLRPDLNPYRLRVITNCEWSARVS